MADVWCSYILLLVYFLHISGLSGNEFLCRDPDTGNPHAVNSTWPSTTFCGNYTCTLRRKNLSTVEYAPMRHFNNSNLQMFINDFQNNIEKQNENIESNFIREERDKAYKKIDKENIEYKILDDDRYLTDNEINIVTQILHFMKKSDLDAILEIYKLIQIIYKEIENSEEKPMDSTLDEAINEPLYKFRINSVHNKPYSYWHSSQNSMSNGKKEQSNKKQGSNIMSIAKSDKATTRFNSHLNSNHFSRIPYYHHITDIQRSNSYTQKPTITTYHPSITNYNKISDLRQGGNVKKTSRKGSKPMVFFPYPFSYVRRFNSIYSDIYLKYNFGNYIFYTKNNKNSYLRNYISQLPLNTVLVNPYLTKDENKKIAENKNDVESKVLASWQIPPLFKDFIEHIRLKIKDRMKILRLWRRNMKLKRVGDVIRLEKIMRSKRETLDLVYAPESKRKSQMQITPATKTVNKTKTVVPKPVKEESTSQNVLYELVIEKITCSVNETTPGYFRQGNSSRPFPECCPQKIHS